MKSKIILASITVALAACAQAQPRDEVLLQMQQAFRQNNQAQLTELLPQAKGHVLEPWAAYWELRNRLETASPGEIRAFFARYAGTYVEDRLRNDWLHLLGERQDWANFAVEYPKFRMNDDREVRCYAILHQFLRDGPQIGSAAQDELRRNWFGQRDPDTGCTLAATQMIGTAAGPGRLTTADAWHKARLAVQANRFRTAAEAVRIAAPGALPLLAQVQASPVKFLHSGAATGSETRRELAVLALLRLAATSPAQAADLMDARWAARLQPAERDWVWGAIGRQAAQRLQPEAHGWFAKVRDPGHLTEDMLEWKIRAALRAGATPDWQGVLKAVDGMPQDVRGEPAWTYWRARALLATQPSQAGREEAHRLLESIVSPVEFYGQLALEELGRKITPPPRPEPLTAAERIAARNNPGLLRGLYAIALGLRSDGVREWNYTTNLHQPGGMPDRELLAAAELACEREVWDRCINTSERTRTVFDVAQRYPMPFRDAVVERSLAIGLDPAYVYGLIRQESRFITDARSHVGASGLMQVMPATARWTARRLGMERFQVTQLKERDVNIAIGTGYLKLVLDDFAGSMPMSAAAYNAGPGRPRAWRNGPVMEAAAWAETVPFHETRDYIKKVLANTTFYSAVLTGQPQSLKARLGWVGPRDPAQAAPNTELP